MADQITDNRTIVDSAEGIGSWVANSGAAQDTEIFIQGTASIGEQITSTQRYILYNAGTPQDWSNNVFYIWINCGIVGLLDLKSLGGFTIRFTGPSVTDFFEFYVGGSDAWPVAIEGGWVQFVVDIEGTPSNTGGTPPLTTAIQHVGYAAVTAGTMTRNTDNVWIDEIRRLPDGSPGIIVEGRNGGTTPWNSADIFTQLTTSTGTFVPSSGGAYKINTPIQFGINDTSIHEFTDTNAIWLWDDQEFAPIDLYSMNALGNAGGTTNVTLGVKTGTGAAAVGTQGLTISAASTGVRWGIDVTDANLDTVGLYGCSFQHGGNFALNSPQVEAINTLFGDITSAPVSGSFISKCNVVNANTADGVAFMSTTDLADIINTSFNFSDGHAVEILTGGAATQSSVGNRFTGYGITTSTDAAIYNNSGAAKTISISSPGVLAEHTYRDGVAATTTLSQDVQVTFTGLPDNTEVRVYAANTITELAGIENATDGTIDDRSFSFTLSASTVVDVRFVNIFYEVFELYDFSIPSSNSAIPITLRFDRNYLT